MSTVNPENKCSDLILDPSLAPELEEMFAMQLKLQNYLAARGKSINYETATFKERVDCLSVQWRNLTLEFSELLERLPFKEWKSYTPEQLEGLDKVSMLETEFEFIDMWHFMMNIALLLKIDGKKFKQLYYVKNKENFDRQERGY